MDLFGGKTVRAKVADVTDSFVVHRVSHSNFLPRDSLEKLNRFNVYILRSQNSRFQMEVSRFAITSNFNSNFNLIFRENVRK